MDNEPISPSGAINLGAEAYSAGDRDEARRLFAWALLKDPENELGWLWFATVADDPAEQRYCLGRAVRLNPESAGLSRLALLPSGPGAIPPDLIQLDTPPLPPGFTGPQGVLPLLPRTAIERRHRARHARATAAAPPPPVAAPVTVIGAPPAPVPRRRVWAAIAACLLIVAAAVLWLVVRPATAGAPYVIAFAGPLSGNDAAIGTEQLNAVTLAVDQLNRDGGINGQPVRVVSFDDQNDPTRAAVVANEIVADEAVNLVIGHDASDASLAAAPIYAAAGLPAISAASSTDALTAFPGYYRVVMSNSQQGAYLALYANQLLDQTRTSIVSTAGSYDSTLAAAYERHFAAVGTVTRHWRIDPTDRAASISEIAAAINAVGDPGIVFLALTPDDAHDMLLALRRAGVAGYVLGGDAIGFEGFLDSFADDPEQAALPGAITDWTYVSSPLIYDSVGGATLAFIKQYEAAYGQAPAWFGAKAYDATTLALAALRQLPTLEAPAPERRAAALQALDGMHSNLDAIPGLTGPLYFDRANTVPQVYSIGLFDQESLLSAPNQYRVVSDLRRFNAVGADRTMQVLDLDGVILRPYRVAYVGIDISEISNLDPVAQTFDADFFLWLRYTGDADAENVFFPNSEDPELRLENPIARSVVNGQQFVMYRVNETFSQPMDFHDYPWDRHDLSLTLQNLLLTEDEIVYVPDRSNLQEPQAVRLTSATDTSRTFNEIPSWIATRVFYSQESAGIRSGVPSEITGDPEYVTASKYMAQISFERDVRAFLIKNLLPLVVLVVVTYISLFFSPENASTRIGFSITAILTSSVLLQSVSSNLPDIGYTVAIEWGYYAYLVLAACLVLANIVVDRWYKGRRYAAVTQLDRIIRVAYPTLILLAVLAYVLYFRQR